MEKPKRLRKARGFDVWLTVGRTNLRVHQVLNRRLADIGLSLAQHEILVAIRQNSGLTQKTLSERLLVVKSNVSALIKKMEAKGLVRRATDRDDARHKRLSLTRAGYRLLQQSINVQNEIVEAMVAVMSNTELEEVGDIMGRVGDALDDYDAQSR